MLIDRPNHEELTDADLESINKLKSFWRSRRKSQLDLQSFERQLLTMQANSIKQEIVLIEVLARETQQIKSIEMKSKLMAIQEI